MNDKTIGILVGVVISVVVFGLIGYASAHFGSNGFNTPRINLLSNNTEFYEKWQEEHDEMLELHQRLANGEITQEEFWDEMQEHHEEMHELHEESGMGCPMMGNMGGGQMMGMHSGRMQ